MIRIRASLSFVCVLTFGCADDGRLTRVEPSDVPEDLPTPEQAPPTSSCEMTNPIEVAARFVMPDPAGRACSRPIERAPAPRQNYAPSLQNASCAEASNFVQMPVANEDFELHVVGVYESQNGQHGLGEPRISGTIDVRLQATTKPVVLALTSYEPVDWNIVVAPDARLEAVVTAGFHAQTVAGVDAPVHHLGREALCEVAFGWEASRNLGGSDFERYADSIEAATGLTIRSFQGCYAGGAFSVPHADCPEEPSNAEVVGNEDIDPREVELGCAEVQASGQFCLYASSGAAGLISIETGQTCPISMRLPAGLYDDSALLWRGEIYYACTLLGLVRGSLLDDSYEVLQITCSDIEYDQGDFFVRSDVPSWRMGEWYRYPDLNAIREGRGVHAPQMHHEEFCPTRHALYNGVLYGSSHSDSELQRIELASAQALGAISLGGYDGWLFGLSITAPGSAVFTTPDDLRVLDLASGQTVTTFSHPELPMAAVDCYKP